MTNPLPCCFTMAPARRVARVGFTLLELSVVLVIIALVTGGLLEGRRLIAGGELQAFLRERQTIITATNNFRDQYTQLPGDFNQATRFWLWQANDATCMNRTGAALASTASLAMGVRMLGVCDGDGNRRVELAPNTAPTSRYGEAGEFWQHLVMAKFLPTVSQELGPTPLGNNYPSRVRSGAWSGSPYWSVFSNPSMHGRWLPFGGNIPNILALGNGWGTGSPAIQPILTPKDAFFIDSKIDDGKASFGQVRYVPGPAPIPAIPACVTGGYYSNTDYNFTNPAARCALYMMRSF